MELLSVRNMILFFQSDGCEWWWVCHLAFYKYVLSFSTITILANPHFRFGFFIEIVFGKMHKFGCFSHSETIVNLNLANQFSYNFRLHATIRNATIPNHAVSLARSSLSVAIKLRQCSTSILILWSSNPNRHSMLMWAAADAASANWTWKYYFCLHSISNHLVRQMNGHNFFLVVALQFSMAKHWNRIGYFGMMQASVRILNSLPLFN